MKASTLLTVATLALASARDYHSSLSGDFSCHLSCFPAIVTGPPEPSPDALSRHHPDRDSLDNERGLFDFLFKKKTVKTEQLAILETISEKKKDGYKTCTALAMKAVKAFCREYDVDLFEERVTHCLAHINVDLGQVKFEAGVILNNDLDLAVKVKSEEIKEELKKSRSGKCIRCPSTVDDIPF